MRHLVDAGYLVSGGDQSLGWPSTGRRICSSSDKHPLKAKAHHAVLRGGVLLQGAMTLTLRVSK